MINKRFTWKYLLLMLAALLCICSIPAYASDDNSLYSLGILTEGAEVTPEFSYDNGQYDVTVPAGTRSLELDPITSNENAWIVDITGQELVDGKTTVAITVSAENGSQYAYYLNVTASGQPSETAVQPVEVEMTEKETEKQTETEPETEDPRYIKVERNSLQEAENTISNLKAEIGEYRAKVSLLTKIIYGMIAFAVLLLFIVINLLLKRKDMKAELQSYRGFGYPDDYYPSANPDGHGYEDQGYYQESYEDENGYYGQQGYYDGYYEQDQEQGPVQGEEQRPSEKQRKQKVKKQKKLKDDPNTVPKPEKARNKSKQMPEYQPQAQPYEYQQPEGKTDKNVEVTMIDL